jgi:F-type H+-transporting ATPase subunit b
VFVDVSLHILPITYHKKIMEKLGIDIWLLLTQVVNFTIMVVVLNKFLYQPILRKLKERQQKIEAGLAFTEKSRIEEEKQIKKRAEALADAREEARAIIETAKKDGKRLKDELLTEGRKEAAHQLIKQEKEMNGKLEEFSAQLTAPTVEIAAGMVGRLLPKILSEEAQHQLIHDELRKLEKTYV